ncbi:anti-repressor SinI family protein [Niallia sp. Krafla_26]
MKIQDTGSQYDHEWVQLLLDAKNLGLSIEVIRQFLQKNSKKIMAPDS